MKSSSSGRNSVRCGESVLDEREKVEELPVNFSVDNETGDRGLC